MNMLRIIRNLARLLRRKSPTLPPVPAIPLPAVVVRANFRRDTSIAPGRAAHPWHWAILLPCGRVYAMSKSFDTLPEAVRDFAGDGVMIVAHAERTLCAP
jgi:hypothetical protein